MDVRLSPEQAELRSAAQRLASTLGPGAVGSIGDAPRVERLDRAIVVAGWRELRSASGEQSGAPWATAVEVAIIVEQLAAHTVDSAFVGPSLAAELRRLVGAPTANVRETVGLTRDLSALATSGSDAVAFDAAGANAVLRLEPAGDGWIVVTSPLGSAGDQIDLTRVTTSIAGGSTPIEGQQRTLTDDDVTRVTVLGLALACADLVGVMDGAVRLAVEYVSQRHQYGRAVGSFQAVQHLLADAHTFTEGSRSAALHAAWAVDALPIADALYAASIAKAYAGRAALAVCETSIQAHGGIGNTWECMTHVFLRRALSSIDFFGGVGAGLDLVLAQHGIARGVA